MHGMRGATSQVIGKQPPTTDFEPRGSCRDPFQGMPGSHCQQQYDAICTIPNGHCHGHKHTQSHVLLMVTAKFCTTKGAQVAASSMVGAFASSALKSSKAYPLCRPSLGLLLPAVHLGRILRPVQIPSAR